MRKAVLPTLTLLLTLFLTSPALAAPKWSVRSLRGLYLCSALGQQGSGAYTWTAQLTLAGNGSILVGFHRSESLSEREPLRIFTGRYEVKDSSEVSLYEETVGPPFGDDGPRGYIAGGHIVQGGKGIVLSKGVPGSLLAGSCWRDR